MLYRHRVHVLLLRRQLARKQKLGVTRSFTFLRKADFDCSLKLKKQYYVGQRNTFDETCDLLVAMKENIDILEHIKVIKHA